jgi:hypothetical protein
MPNKDEKAQRKEVLHRVRDEERQRTLAAFPAAPPVLKQLFGYLDQRLSADGCDDTLRFAREFVLHNALPEQKIVAWLEENGGYCDCEALDNVEQIVSEAVPDYDHLGKIAL